MTRVLLAALINSELSIRELRELADEMSASPVFLFDFSALLKETIDRLRESGSKKQALRGNEPVADQDFAYSIIQRRRLSKSKVLNIIGTVSPAVRSEGLSIDSSVREILEKFFRSASTEEVQKFMDRIQPGDSSDAYLRGIIRKD